MGLVRLADLTSKPAKKAGGDDGVERDGMDRPLIITDCWKCRGLGRLPSEKREGQTVQCSRCKGEGKKKDAFTRVTTYIDVLDDTSSLMAWKARMVLIGVANDMKLLNGVLDVDPASKDGRNELNRKAEAAADLGGANTKSEKGTYLHELSEKVDRGEDIGAVVLDDLMDMDAYARATEPFNIVRMEQLVVNDQYKCAGTPDRNSTWWSDIPLVAPDGYMFGPEEVIVTDLKTGRVDYGALKMAMQLAMYAHSDLYDKETGARIPTNLNRKWGIIMHLAAGSAQCDLYWADLTLGWEAIAVAKSVREFRNKGRKALVPVSFASADSASGEN